MKRLFEWLMNLLDFGWTRSIGRRQHKREMAEREASHPPFWYPSVIKNKRVRRIARKQWINTGMVPPGWWMRLLRLRLGGRV